MLKKLEVVTNVAIILVAVLLAAVLVKDRLMPRTSSPPTLPPDVAIGSKISLPGTPWMGSRGTLVLVLGTGCHFCTESADFYRRLATAPPRADVHLTAVFPQTVEAGREYLTQLKVGLGDVRQVPLFQLGVRGTPTLLWVDAKGVLRGKWVGKLPADKEEEVMETVFGSRSD